jgi:tape measure domain-containing protein
MANNLNVTLGLDLTPFEKSLVRLQKRLGELSRNLEGIGQTMTQNLTLPILGIGAAAVKSFADFDKLERGLTAVMGTSEAASAELEKLKEAARAPGLGFEEAVRGSIRLQAVGLSADEARGTLQAFGAAIAATGGTAENLESVQYQLTQMISKNRILQEDFGILQENVPLLGKAVQQAFGTANIEQIRATGISAQDFNKRLVEALQSLPEVQKATGGLGNAFDNFKDSINLSLVELGDVINETLNLEKVFNSISDAVAALVGWFKQLSPGAQKFVITLAAIIAGVGPLLFLMGKFAGLLATLSSGFQLLISLGPKLGAAFTIATGPVGLIVLAVVGAIAVIAALYNKFEGVRRVVNGVGQAFIEFAKLAKNSFSALLDGFARLKEGDFRGAATQFGKSLQVLNPIEQGRALAVGFAKGFEDTTNYLEPTVQKIKEQVQSVQKSLFGGTAPTPTALPGGGGGGGKNINETIQQSREVFNVEPLTRYRQEITLTANELEKYGTTLASAQLNSSLASEQTNARLADTRTILTEVAAAANSTRAYFEQMNVSAGLLGQGEWVNVIETAFDTLGSSLQSAITNTENFAKAVKRAFLDILGVVINEIILYQIRNFLASPAGLALGPIGGAAALGAGKALGSIVKGLFGAVKLAKGGLAFGPTSAIVGDNPAARTDPEVIAPLSKLKDYLNPGGGAMIAEARISGNDLLILVNNAERANNRIR